MFSFLLILLYSFIRTELITVTQTEGSTIDLNNDKNIVQVIMEQCSCDLVKGVCEPFCCCDLDCEQNVRESWENDGKCIDEETTAKIQSYKCIRKKLLTYYNKKKGIQDDNSNDKYTCFSKDNDENGDNLIKNLYKRDETKLNTLKQKIYNEFKNQNLKQQTISLSPGGTSNDFIYATYSVSNVFVIDNVFSLLQKNAFGECTKGRGVRFYEAIPRYTCINKNGEFSITSDEFRSYLIQPGATETIQISTFIYTENNGEPDIKSDNTASGYIKEYAFEIELTEKNETSTEIVAVGAISKVAVILTVTREEPKILAFSLRFKQSNSEAYPYSGNVGYIIGYPLKIAFLPDETTIYSYYDGFYTKGKKSNGECRLISGDTKGQKIYPIDLDQPILFGVDLDYSCNYPPDTSCSQINELITTQVIYRNSLLIQLVGRVGSALLNSTLDWKPVDQSGIVNESIPPATLSADSTACSYSKGITLNISYYEMGPENDKQNFISEAKIAFDELSEEAESSTKTFSFKVRYLKLTTSSNDNDPLRAKAEMPTIMPRLPKDLIDPITKPES